MSSFEEVLYEDNPKRKRRKKATPKRRTRRTRRYSLNPNRRASSVATKKAVAKSRKHYVPVVVVNPIGRDVVKDLKTGGLITAGLVVAYGVGAWLKEKYPDTFASDKSYAIPLAQIGIGIGVGVMAKGRYRDLATKVGLGSVAAGLLTAVTPYIADKVSGLPPVDAAIASNTDLMKELPGGTVRGYTTDVRGYTDMGAYAFNGIGNESADVFYNEERYGV